MKRKIQLTHVKLVAAAILFILMCGAGYSQTYKRKAPLYIGGGVENFSTGNWHGAFYSPYVNMTRGRGAFNFGPLIQKRTMELNGGKMVFSYNLSGPRKFSAEVDEDAEEIPAEDYVKEEGRQILQLNIFTFGQFIHESTAEDGTKSRQTNLRKLDRLG
jgi:hypothetical protein